MPGGDFTEGFVLACAIILTLGLIRAAAEEAARYRAKRGHRHKVWRVATDRGVAYEVCRCRAWRPRNNSPGPQMGWPWRGYWNGPL